MIGGAQKLPEDYFVLGTSTCRVYSRRDPQPYIGENSAETQALRKKCLEGCEQSIWDFFNNGGQVVIYDANNGTLEQRARVAEKFGGQGIHVVFLGECPSAA